MESLKAFIIERLTVAADEIFGAVEKVMVECQEEAERTKEERTCLQRLDSVSKPDIRTEVQSHRAEEEVRGRRTHLDQENPEPTVVNEEPENPEPTAVKEEHENPERTVVKVEQEDPEPTLEEQEQAELWTNQREDELPALSSDTEDFTLAPPCDFDQILVQPQIKTEPDSEGYGGPGPTSDLLLLSVVDPDFTARGESSGLLQSGLKPLNSRRSERRNRWTFSSKDRNSSELWEPLTSQTGESPHRHADCQPDQCSVRGLTGEGPHQCNEWRYFSRKSNLVHHTMSSHTGTSQFKCKECGKCFSRKPNLNRHMMIHTGQKPFKCKECGKAFNRKHHLNYHVMSHHTEKKQFQCKICRNCFSRKCDLNCHVMKHWDQSIVSI